jgi:hypothetical protein
MNKDIRRRLATFGFLVGGAMLALFFTSDASSTPNTNILLYGILLILFASAIGKNTKPEPIESNRFRTLRRLQKGEGLFPKPEVSEEDNINSEN